MTVDTEAAAQPLHSPPSLRPVEFARWSWRQLTSMRVALVLLFLLAVVAVPGSVLPQRRVNPIEVELYLRGHPTAGPWLDRFRLFDVYTSPWFSAVYLLLFISLIGCVVPRTAKHLRTIRARPPVTPRNLDRLPVHRRFTSPEPADAVLDRAAQELRRRRYRIDRYPDAVAAERGHLRETGNLLFHTSLLVILLGAAIGALWGWNGTVILVEGDDFASTPTQYDAFAPGILAGADDLPPFLLRLDDFEATFVDAGPTRGAAKDFIASVTYRAEPGAAAQRTTIRVNYPLKVDGANVNLLGHGYAPQFTVRDAAGNVVFSGAVPFLPQDNNFVSTGAIKIPDIDPQQLGFNAFFLPTTVIAADGRPTSIFPDARNPSVVLQPWAGDLGLDAGAPQSVYRLDTSAMQRVESSGVAVTELLGTGQTLTLPDGLGSITYDGYLRWVNLKVSRNPGLPVLGLGAALAVIGVTLSLFVRRRRVWVRVTDRESAGIDSTPSATVAVEVAGLDRAYGAAIEEEVDTIAAAVAALAGGPRGSLPTATEDAR